MQLEVEVDQSLPTLQAEYLTLSVDPVVISK